MLRGILNFIYSILKFFFPVRDRVLFISRESDSASENFLLIAEEIRKRSPNTDLRFSCKRDKSDLFGLSNPFLMLDRMRLLAGSRVCITESDSAEFGVLNHRKELRIIQIWHSMAPFRKFGWQTVGTEGGISLEFAEGIRLHHGYDYIIVGSKFAEAVFAEAMNNESSLILPLGMPVTDIMCGSTDDTDKLVLWKKHPSTCGKKIIVYAPTIRKGEAVPCDDLVRAIDYDTFSLVVKLHPKDNITRINDERVIVEREISTQEAMRAADIIITDYSGVAAEASLLTKPVFFYTPDLEKYSGQCGLNINPAELFPEITFSDANKLSRALCEDMNTAAAEHLREKLAGACTGNSAAGIACLATETSIQNADSAANAASKSRLSDFAARCIYSVKYLGARIDPMLILFESKLSRTYSGDVKELFEAVCLDKKFENCRFAWAVASPEDSKLSDPVLVVKFGSPEHMQLHARARAIVSDAPVSNRVRLRSEQQYFVADEYTKESLRRII